MRKSKGMNEFVKKEIKKALNQKTAQPFQVAEEIMSQYDFITPDDTETLHVYDNGIYTLKGEQIVKIETVNKYIQKTTRYFINEVINIIKIKTFVKESEVNDKNIIPLLNCYYNLEKNKTEKFTPKIYTTRKLNIKYDPKADCKKFKKFIKEIVAEHDIPTIQEMFGYCLYNTNEFQKAFILLGEGMNGKSTLIDVLTELLGLNNVSHVSMQDLASNKFTLGQINNKLANLFPDLPSTALQDTGILKALISGDRLYCDVKFGQGFHMTNKAKMVFSTNKLPKTSDTTKAFFRRWIMINFPNEFPPEKRDTRLFYKLTTKKELSGIFNWSIEGLKRLLTNKRFTYNKTTQEIQKHYTRLSNSVESFVNDKLEVDNYGDGIETSMLFFHYNNYCKAHNLVVEPLDTFRKRIPEYIKTQSVQKRTGSDRKYYWIDIKLVDDDEEKK